MDSRSPTRRAVSRRSWLVGSAGGAVTLLAGCRETTRAGRRLRIWSHQGQEAEHRALRAIAAAFDHQPGALGPSIELSFFPDFQYMERLSVAAAARDLPDVFELDGPLVARFVDAGLLAPLEPWLSPDVIEDFLPSVRAQGSIGGRLYALGAFDSAMVLYYDRRQLAAAQVDPPEANRGFEWSELLAACARLSAAGFPPLGLHMNESADEWFTYAFSPVIWSGGGRLIGADGLETRGVLASAANVASLRGWQELFLRGFAAADPIDPDPFGNGAVAMDWSGHWMARSHLARKGHELGVMSLPHFGAGPVAPCGSYCWAISAQATAPELAARWLRWVTGAQTGIAPLVAANGAVPARRSAFAAFPEYARLPFALFRQQLEERARARPRTPFYATLTQRWAAALRDIAHGAEVGQRLARAEREVARVIERRRGPGRGAPS